MTQGWLTVGVVTPHEAPGPEVELPAMTRGRVTTVVSRTSSLRESSSESSSTSPPSSASPTHPELRASTGAAALDYAAAAFAGSTLAAVAHASTTSAYVIGHRGEAALVERLSQRFDVPAVASCSAVAAALRTHEAERLQLVHPPWFDDEFDQLATAHFRSLGFDAEVTKATGLPADPARVEPQHVIDWLAHNVSDRAEAIFLAGNGFRAAETIEELERRTGRLVLTANQALLWGILAATGTKWDVVGYGQVLRRAPTTVPSRPVGR
jgi:maleate isomerase